MRGLFVTFEGIDRSGKTTQAGLLVDALGDEALGVREPGGTPAGEQLRDILKDPEVALVAGDRGAAVRGRSLGARGERDPAGAGGREGRGSDRFLDSSLAYQGGARGLGIEDVERVNHFATRGLRPDLTFLLDLSPDDAAARAGESDRFEDEGAELQEAVGAAYERLMRADPERWRRIDATPLARGGPRRRAGRRWRRHANDGRRSPARRTTRRRGWCCRRRWRPASPRTPICSTGRPGPASGRWRGRSRRSCWRRAPTIPDAVRTRVMHGAHPDLTWVRPSGAHVMRVDDVEGPVVSAATRTPFEARRRVFVLERVDTMNDEVANRLLKTLEEPASYVHLILMTDALGRVLETVVIALPAGALRAAAGGDDRGAAGGRGRAGRAGGGVRAAGARERGAGSLPGVAEGEQLRARGRAARGGGARRRRPTPAPSHGDRCSPAPRRRARRAEEAVAEEAKRRLELEPKGRERKAIEKEFEEAAKRDGAAGAAGVAGALADAGRADLPRPDLPGRGGARGRARARTARPRSPSRREAATRAACARRPSAARRCASRWS